MCEIFERARETADSDGALVDFFAVFMSGGLVRVSVFDSARFWRTGRFRFGGNSVRSRRSSARAYVQTCGRDERY